LSNLRSAARISSERQGRVSMEPKFDHKKIEQQMTDLWEKGGYFKAARDPKKKPYTIVLPPPNASGKMHTGNVLMIAIEDLLIRWKRMQGYSALWLPGTDHAGFETQTTFERELKAKGKSRFDYDRNTLYKMIWDFVQDNKSKIEQQIRNMGASVDWSRYTFTLDPRVVDTVVLTFEKMEKEGLVYRSDYVVNYSFKWGTTFSDAEIVYREENSALYYMKYGPFVLATTRPETKFGDTAVAVNPNDKRYKQWVGKEIEVEGLIGKFKVKVIADNYVDPEFGTGVVKITPAHDKNDWEVGLRHNLEIKNVINLNGRLNNLCGKYAGLKIAEARKVVVEDMQKAGMMVKIDDNYIHTVPVVYRDESPIEQLVLPNWFIKVDDPKKSLKKMALDVVKNKKLKIYPKWREITYTRWVENMHDWAISRQVVWGIRIPAWYDVSMNPEIDVTFIDLAGKIVVGKVSELLRTYPFEELEQGLQNLRAPKSTNYVISKTKPQGDFLQETDTFDTWFSSGQWPLVTLGYPDSEDFKYFYPTSVLETGWEIVTRWVSRMVMFGMYLTGESPFKDIYLHGLVRAIGGKKMSKSLGNIVNPEEYIEEFGVDALRMGLISGTANGRDFAFPKDKVTAYRNFANKIWNMARFILMMVGKYEKETGKKVEVWSGAISGKVSPNLADADSQKIIAGLAEVIKGVDKNLEKYRFADAGEEIYQFMWHEVADGFIEHVKIVEDADLRGTALGVLLRVYADCLKLLHPFMPFVTEAVWQEMRSVVKSNEDLANSTWPAA
jgi:valyl-tRNA synthetase